MVAPGCLRGFAGCCAATVHAARTPAIDAATTLASALPLLRMGSPFHLFCCLEGTSHADAAGTRATGRPNRSYKIGTTIMFSAVELNRPNMMTIAIGA